MLVFLFAIRTDAGECKPAEHFRVWYRFTSPREGVSHGNKVRLQRDGAAMIGRISGPDTGSENGGLRVPILLALRRSLPKRSVCGHSADRKRGFV